MKNSTKNNNLLKDGYSLLSQLSAKGLLAFKKTILYITVFLEIKFYLHHFQSFVKAYSNLFSINTKGNNSVPNMTRLLLLFFAIFRCHDSEFVQKLVEQSISARFPNFVLSILANISSRTVSLSSKHVNVYGNVSLGDFNLYSYIYRLKLKENDYFHSLAIDTPFITIFSDTSNITKYKNYLISHIDKLFEQVSHIKDPLLRDVRLAILIFEQSDMIPLPEKVSSYGMTHTTISSSESKFLGIYRFANSDESLEDRNIYQVNIQTLNGVSEETFQFLTSFLFLFRPKFSIPSCPMSGFQEIDFNGIDTKHVWETYLSSKPKNSLSNGNVNTKNRKFNNKPIQPEIHSAGDVEHDIFSINKSNSFEYHDTIDFLDRDRKSVV